MSIQGIESDALDESLDVPIPGAEDQTQAGSNAVEMNQPGPIPPPPGTLSFGVELDWELAGSNTTPLIGLLGYNGPTNNYTFFPSPPIIILGFAVPGGTYFAWSDAPSVAEIENASAPGSSAPFSYPAYNPFLDAYGNPIDVSGSGISIGGQWAVNTYNDTTNAYNSNFSSRYSIRSTNGATRKSVYSTLIPPGSYSISSVNWSAASSSLIFGLVVYPVSGTFTVELHDSTGAIFSYSGSLAGVGGTGSYAIPPFTTTRSCWAEITVSGYGYDVTAGGASYGGGWVDTTIGTNYIDMGMGPVLYGTMTPNTFYNVPSPPPGWPVLTCADLPGFASPIQPGDGVVFPVAGAPGRIISPGHGTGSFVLSVGIVVS